MTFDFAPLAWVYFWIGAATLVITTVSRNPSLMFGTLIMMASWLASNEIVRQQGHVALIAHDAVISAVLAVCVASVGSVARSQALAIVFGLFALNVAVDIATLALIYHMGLIVTRGVTVWYAVIVNAIFVASCLALGVAGVGTRLVHRRASRPGQPDRARQRRGAVVAGMAGE